jgi:hypothetical protein
VSNKPQVFPWDPDAVLQFPSGGVAYFDGSFWHADGQLFTHRQFQQEMKDVPFVRLLPMTAEKSDAFEAGRQSALQEVGSKVFYTFKEAEKAKLTGMHLNGIAAAQKVIEGIE